MANRINMKRKHFIWIIAVITVINLSAAGTVLYHMKFHERESEEELFEAERRPMPPEARPGRFLRDKLNLSPEQHTQFRELRRDFHSQANNLTYQMQIKRNEMITELAKENPDTSKLKKIAGDIGDMHAELKGLTIDYYMGMKEICTPEQEEELYKIFKVLINRDENLPIPGRVRNRGPNPNF